MANLDNVFSWERWAPNIGDNRTRAGGPVLWLQLATGLTAAQLAGMKTRWGGIAKVPLELPPVVPDELPEARAAAIDATFTTFKAGVRAVVVGALGDLVRVEGGPHTVAGKPLATLEDYVGLIQERADMGFPALGELRGALERFNSMEGPDELFSRRSSGGARSTDAQSTEPGEPPTAVH